MRRINVLNQRSTRATVQQMRRLISTHEQKPPETRRKIIRSRKPVVHVLTPSGGIPAFDHANKKLGHADCIEYTCDPDGQLKEASTIRIYNQGPKIPEDVFIIAVINRAGLLVASPSIDVFVDAALTQLLKSYGSGDIEIAPLVDCQ